MSARLPLYVGLLMLALVALAAVNAGAGSLLVAMVAAVAAFHAPLLFAGRVRSALRAFYLRAVHGLGWLGIIAGSAAFALFVFVQVLRGLTT